IAAAIALRQALAGTAQYLLHGFDEHALTHHLRRLLVFSDQQVEAFGLTLGPGDHRLTVTGSLFQQTLGLTAGFRNHAVGVGFGLVALAHFVFPGTDHVVEGILHLGRGLGALDVDLHHGNTGLVGIQITLQTLGGLDAHLFTAFGQYLVHRRGTDHVTQGTFSGVAQTGFRVFHLEHEVFQVGDAILHRQRYLDDILVLGQHLPLLAIGAHLGDVALEFLLDRREIDVQAGFDGTVVFTETQHYCLLLLIHLVDGIEQPEHEDDQTADDPEPLGDPLAAADPTTAAAI